MRKHVAATCLTNGATRRATSLFASRLVCGAVRWSSLLHRCEVRGAPAYFIFNRLLL